MIKIMAVYDEDPLYARRLADYVNHREKLPFTAMAFSGLEELEAYGKEHEIEILLAGERAMAQIREHQGTIRARQSIMLCEGELAQKKEEEASIYKYQSGDCIMREVMACYCSHPVEPGLALLSARAKVMGVYSPVNRCGKTSLALTIGQVLSRSMSVLFISLEEFSSLSRLVWDQPCVRDLSDVLYVYKQGAFNWMKLKSMIYSQGSLDFIPPSRYGEDLDQLPPEELALLIGQIAAESGYDRLVVDLGQMGRGARALLDVCDVVYMPVLEDGISSAKTEAFEEFLQAADAGRIRDKLQKLRLPAFQVSAGNQEGYMEQLLWGELGDFVRRLLGGGLPGEAGM